MIEAGSENEAGRRPLVCFVADEQWLDHCPTMLRFLQVGLIDAAFDVLLVTPQGERFTALRTGPTGQVYYRPVVKAMGRWVRRDTVWEVVRAIGSMGHGGPVVVHSLSSGVFPMAVEIAEATSAELLHSIWSPQECEDSRIACRVMRATALIAPTETLRRNVMTRWPMHPRIELVPLGVVAGGHPSAFRGKDRSPSLAVSGRLSGDCGVDLFLRAVKRVLQDRPDLFVVIMGKGPAETGLRRLAESLNISDNVVFTGRFEHARAAMESCDLFCLPHGESIYGEDVLQAMAAGLAIVASHKTLCDGLVDGSTAVLFTEGDEYRMAEQISRLLQDRTLAQRIAHAAWERAKSDHSVAKMVSGLIDVYRKVEERERTLAMPTAR